MRFPFAPVMQQLWNTLLRETVCVCDLNSNHSSWLLTQNSAHGKLLERNEKSDRVQDRFDFTPGPGVGFVLATNRTETLAFPSSAVLFIPTFGGCVTNVIANAKIRGTHRKGMSTMQLSSKARVLSLHTSNALIKSRLDIHTVWYLLLWLSPDVLARIFSTREWESHMLTKRFRAWKQ